MAESTRRRRRAAGLAAGLVAVPVALGVVGASAAPVGTVASAQFRAWKPAGSALLLAEDFTGTDGTALVGTTTDHTGQTWSQTGGVWTIQGNAARSTAAGGSSLFAPTGSMHHAVEARVTVGSFFDVGIFANGNAGRSDLFLMAFTHADGGRLALYAIKNNNINWVGVNSVGGLGTNGTFTLRLEAGADNVIRCYVDGTLRATYTYGAGDISTFKQSDHDSVGFWHYNDSASVVDDVHVDRIMPG